MDNNYKNNYNKNHYDRINLMVPAGKKDEIRTLATAKNMSVNEYIWSAITKEMHNADTIESFDISNRRYVGSKRALIPFIRSALKHIRFDSFADIFAGTGVVASAFNSRKRIITNDILYSNYICHYAWFSVEEFDEKKIQEVLTQYNSLVTDEENYVTETYSDKYFSHQNAAKIGYIRECIEQLKIDGSVNKREYALLIMSLLYASQKADVSRTVGHYMTWLKKPKEDGKLQLRLPLAPSAKTNQGNLCYNMDALDLVKRISPVDVIYIDPPYMRQYGEYYHVLENIAKWEKATTYGDTHRIRTPKSEFSLRRKAFTALEGLIQECQTKSKYILVSYNNDERNNITNIDMMTLLSQIGKTQVYTQDYPAFHGSKLPVTNKERLFLCKVRG